jgi:hypothetical protein
VGIESTVLSLAGSEPVLLRPGMVSLAESSVESASFRMTRAATERRPRVSGTACQALQSCNTSPDYPRSSARPGAYVWWSEERPASVSVRMPADAAAYARRIYATLHRLDEMKLGIYRGRAAPAGDGWAGYGIV